MSEALTGPELAAIPPEAREYTCQQCGKVDHDPALFRMVKFLGIGFVICLACIIGPDNEGIPRAD